MIYIIIIITVFVGEYFIKKSIEENRSLGKEEPIMKGNIIIQKYHNKGAMLNFLEKKPMLVSCLSAALLLVVCVVFGVLLPKKGKHLAKFGLALLIGGAASNVWDRLEKGYVVDYFSFKQLKKVIFNLADIAVFLGGICLVLATLLKGKK